MIRFCLRLVGLVTLAAGFAALVVDGTRAIAAGVWRFSSLAASLAAVNADAGPRLLQRLPAAWQAHAAAALEASPTAVVLGGLGLLLFAITARRSRRREDAVSWDG